MKWIRQAAIAAAISIATVAAHADEIVHKLAVQVDENDAATMNLALNNVQNVIKHYEAKGEKVVVEVVAYGPGLNMYVPDKSPVKDRISAISLENPEVTFAACENTRQAMIKKAGHDIVLMSEATSVPSGVVRLMELQDDGYAYVKP